MSSPETSLIARSRAGVAAAGLAFLFLLPAGGLFADSQGQASTDNRDRLELEQIRVVALDPPQRAVIRVGDGPLRAVEPGNSIDEAGARLKVEVKAIGIDKIVVEATSLDDEPIRLTAWIYKAETSPNGQGAYSRVLRLDPRNPVPGASTRPISAPAGDDAKTAARSHTFPEEEDSGARKRLGRDDLKKHLKKLLAEGQETRAEAEGSGLPASSSESSSDTSDDASGEQP